jgi:citrate lyase subunit beta/citryl-CoA lyase
VTAAPDRSATGTPAGGAPRLRSLLFLPASRPELLGKVHRWRPDAVVVDLEDAVAPAGKDAAREAGVLQADLRLPGITVLVRVNPPGTPWHQEDLDAACRSGAAGVVLPKAERPEDLAAVRERLAADRDAPVVVAGIETAVGVVTARELLTGGATAAYFGAEDYVADIGGRRTPDGLEVLYARSQVALAGRLGQVPVIDQAVVALHADDAFTTDAERGRDLGYAGKICIHPDQVALAHAVFTPSDADVDHANRVLAAAGSGLAVVDGQMVDDVHVRLARQVLARRAPATDTDEEQAQ